MNRCWKESTERWMLLKYLEAMLMLWRLEFVLDVMFCAELAKFIADLYVS
jgi:hypothetical protein